MKYSELISFKPIESTIQLLETAEKSAARDVVSTYVMSDAMADAMQAPVIDQLQMEDVVDNKAIMVVGNFGTGKSHLMSMISAVASDEDDLQYLQNKKFAASMQIIAGRFEVLRMKVDGLTMPLREIILGEIEDDFAARGIDWAVPDLSNVRDNSRVIKDLMTRFQEKYPDKGYLIVIDELLSYLTSRDERQIVLDLAFLQSMAEMCSKSRLRLMCGVQEKVFDNPRFSFVSETLKKVGDRFTQIIITKEATAYVVSERILKKTPEQKALIRKHLEKFTSLYTGMSSRLEEFVDLFPIHPSYIDVFNRIYLIENRHILKNISICIRKIFDTDVPEDAPGIYSFDDYWPAIKSNGLLRSDTTISRVVNASQQLEDIINRAFPKPAYKPLAIQIIYALSVHRLTTNGLDVQFGMTAESLKDDLCLYLQMPEQDADFLLGAVNATLKAIMTTVSGQFIIFNDANNQYYIDVDKIVDYDEKIKQKASVMAESELNAFFYKVVYQYASKSMQIAWDELFHRSANMGFEATRDILVSLLRRAETFTNETLQDIINEFVDTCESVGEYPWRYYYVKYSSFRPGSYGKYSNNDAAGKPYMFSVMQTRSQWSASTYMPYLKEADAAHLSRDSMGQRLVYGDVHIICTNNSFVLRNNETEEVIETVEIQQNENGVDIQDRIIVLMQFINRLVDIA